MRREVEIADILKGVGRAVKTPGLNAWQLHTLSALRRCRTSALGGHVDACSACGIIRISYNSCRNRHCPKCQGNKREEWIRARNNELLPVPYFHLVFTLPSELNMLCLHSPEVIYGILFRAAWDTLRGFASKKLLRTGMISVLHTWGQNLMLHPHLHCIVPGGGIDAAGRWKLFQNKGKYLFSVKSMSAVFRAKFVALLRKTSLADNAIIEPLFEKPWVVYAKRPFANPEHVVEYLGRYTHKVAISNSRIKDYSIGKVTFSYKDYRHACVKKQMTLDDAEFVRRFSLHILPSGFVRIRHYGILSSTSKKKTIPLIRKQHPKSVGDYAEPRKLKTFNPEICPCCGKASMVVIESIPPRGPPDATSGHRAIAFAGVVTG